MRRRSRTPSREFWWSVIELLWPRVATLNASRARKTAPNSRSSTMGFVRIILFVHIEKWLCKWYRKFNVLLKGIVLRNTCSVALGLYCTSAACSRESKEMQTLNLHCAMARRHHGEATASASPSRDGPLPNHLSRLRPHRSPRGARRTSRRRMRSATHRVSMRRACATPR